MPEISAPSLDWGRKNEARALAEFKMRHDDAECEVQPFIVHPTMPFFVGTPDAIVQWPNSRVGCETKAPYNPTEHEKVRRFGVPEKYWTPLQGYMELTGLLLWWFVSYDPRRNLDEQYVEILVKRDYHYADTVLRPGIEDFWRFVINDHKVPAPILDQQLVPQVF